MATYTPTSLIGTKLFGQSAATISTWSKRAVGATDIHRTLVLATSATSSVTIQMGTVQANTVSQRLFDLYQLAANRPFVISWFVCVPNLSYFDGFVGGSDNVSGLSAGYSFS
jgi:hypothetical protein